MTLNKNCSRVSVVFSFSVFHLSPKFTRRKKKSIIMSLK